MTIEKNTLLVGIGALLIGLMAGFALDNDHGNYQRKDRDRDGMHRMSDGTMMKDDGKSGGMMEHTMMMVSSEKEFITGMIPHHEEAVTTATQVLERGGTTPEIKALAEGIIAAQEKEITQMKAWYQTWYGEAYTPSGTYKPMMRDLSALNGTELDKAFLTDMIPHHMGAVMMAKQVTAHIEHEEMKTLTQNITQTQTAEIQTMQEILKGL